MRIILDPAFLSTRYTPGSRRFLLDLVIEMAIRNPDDFIVLLSDNPARHLNALPQNVSIELVKTGAWGWLGWPLWKRFRMLNVMKRFQGELLITTEATTLYSRAAPVCFIELNASKTRVQFKQKKKLPFYKPLLKRLKAISGVITLSPENKAVLETLVPEWHQKIHVLDVAPIEHIQPLKWVDKENIKVQYAGGKEYFLYAGDLDEGNNLLMLLKAFSRFKKRQMSNLQLVLAGDTTSSTAAFSEKLATFKYKVDVHLLADPSKEVLIQLIGSAYALVEPDATNTFHVNTTLAVYAGIPVIAFAALKDKRATAGVMYTPEETEQGFADSMQLIYKDEDMRATIIREGLNHVAGLEKYDVVEAFRQLLIEILQTNHSNFTII